MMVVPWEISFSLPILILISIFFPIVVYLLMYSIINKDKIKYINRFGSDILLAHYVYFHVSVVVV